MTVKTTEIASPKKVDAPITEQFVKNTLHGLGINPDAPSDDQMELSAKRFKFLHDIAWSVWNSWGSRIEGHLVARKAFSAKRILEDIRTKPMVNEDGKVTSVNFEFRVAEMFAESHAALEVNHKIEKYLQELLIQVQEERKLLTAERESAIELMSIYQDITGNEVDITNAHHWTTSQNLLQRMPDIE